MKHITGPEDELDVERRRLQSDAASFNSNRRLATSSVSEIPMPGRGLPRERRSKSTAFIQSKKSGQTPSSSSVTHNLSQSGGSEDASQYGRSPRTWIQKIEDWHKEMKIQKEKKKAEKRLRQGQRADSMFSSSATRSSQMSQVDRGSSSVRRTRKSFSSSPPPRSHFKMQDEHRYTSSMNDIHSPINRNARSAGPRQKKELTELPLSRSFSDPFHSPNGVAGPSPWQRKPSRREIQDQIDAQIVIRSQDPHNQDFKRDERLAEHGGRGRSRREQHSRTGNGGDSTSQRQSEFSLSGRTSIQSSASSSSYATASSAARVADEKPMSRKKSHSDVRKPPLQHPKATSSSSNSVKTPFESEFVVSPAFSQLRGSDFHDEDYDAMQNPYVQPIMRRNMSMPATESSQQGAHKWMMRTVGTKRPPTADSARVIRERAHVVSYLQRKLSDASSLAGSISRSPRGDRMDTTRLSGSSSGSSRMSDQIFGSNRSAKPYRKGSFSFFDKLSSDLESCLDDLNTSYMDDSDLASDVGSSTLPLPAKNGTSVLDEWRRRSSFAAYRS